MTTLTPLYNVRQPNGALIERDCTATQAAEVILTHDGADWCVVSEPGFPKVWMLRTRRASSDCWRHAYIDGTYLVVAGEHDDATRRPPSGRPPPRLAFPALCHPGR